jgi:hypothetical protein
MQRRLRIAGLLAVVLLAALGVVALLRDATEAAREHAYGDDDAPTQVDPGSSSSPAPASEATPTSTDAASTAPADLTFAAPVAPMSSRVDPSDAELRARIAAGEPGLEVLAWRLPVETTPLAPRWEAGDEWLVETWYRQMQAHDESWSGPALWRFRVEREVSFRDEPCVELVVTRADEPDVAPLTLWVGRDHGRLVGVETTVTQQGKAQRSLYVPEQGDGPEALRAPLTSAPVRLPPLGALATVAPPGLPFGRTPFSSTSDAPPGAPPPAELVGAGGAYLDIEFHDPLDGTTIRQRWAQGDLRWPVVSRTETTVSLRRG